MKERVALGNGLAVTGFVRACAWVVIVLGLGAALGAGVFGWTGVLGPAVLACLAGAAVGMATHATLRSYAFTVWVAVFVGGAMVHPPVLLTWFGYDLKGLIVPLIQIIMFGMGTTLSAGDFARVARMPWPVLIGLLLQFGIMPVAGYLIATGLGFSGEIAAGVVLIGSCPGGVASNVMAYLARGNVPLSVTMTACSTLLAPLMTPLMMKLLAGRMITVDGTEMMLAICNMIIVPIVAGLVANRILFSDRRALARPGILVLLALGSLIGALVVSATPVLFGPLHGGVVLGCLLISLVTLTKHVVQVLLGGSDNWLNRALPVISMAGICLILGIITARSSSDLLSVGLPLAAAAILHNLTGYLLGYWGARLAGLDERDCRTVAIEVGMQNGGMASGLAMNMLHSPKAALAAAMFGPWMNTSGSVLATWWRSRPTGIERPTEHDTETTCSAAGSFSKQPPEKLSAR
ncbi:MAG: bile acid:sodium symporter family protein [Patescibacteria group bacterium]|nr:bile acid:sodium symporter family protein [Patescibacteria group bacterium]